MGKFMKGQGHKQCDNLDCNDAKILIEIAPLIILNISQMIYSIDTISISKEK